MGPIGRSHQLNIEFIMSNRECYLVDWYCRKLNLSNPVFSYIDHEDAMVAAVFKISQPKSPDLILKVFPQKGAFLRELYFLSFFADKIPIPRIIRHIEPEEGFDGAILMECIQGDLLKSETITKALAWETGSLLAQIHLERSNGYGDLANPAPLSDDPRNPFKMKFEEGLQECTSHLPERLLENCRRHFAKDIDLLLCADGPCTIHRDFRPGNLIASKGKLQGIIDWSSARGGFAEEDFCPLEFGEWPSSCKTSFLDGYASIRKIPNYKSMLPILRLSKAIAAVGFTIKRGTFASKNLEFYQFNLNYLESLATIEERI